MLGTQGSLCPGHFCPNQGGHTVGQGALLSRLHSWHQRITLPLSCCPGGVMAVPRVPSPPVPRPGVLVSLPPGPGEGCTPLHRRPPVTLVAVEEVREQSVCGGRLCPGAAPCPRDHALTGPRADEAAVWDSSGPCRVAWRNDPQDTQSHGAHGPTVPMTPRSPQCTRPHGPYHPTLSDAAWCGAG